MGISKKNILRLVSVVFFTKKNVVPRATVTPAGDSIFLLKLFSLHARDVHIFRTLTA